MVGIFMIIMLWGIRIPALVQENQIVLYQNYLDRHPVEFAAVLWIGGIPCFPGRGL